MLARVGGDARLVSRAGGYQLLVDPSRADAHRFRALVRDAAGVDVPPRREELLRDALDLWRGPALQDAPTDRLPGRPPAALNELRLPAIRGAMDPGLRPVGQHGLGAGRGGA